MFVRWKRRERLTRKRRRKSPSPAAPRPTGKHLLSAVLVRSERVGGKPRQRVVAYLGAIGEDEIAQLWPRVHFWNAVGPRLASLNLDAAERGRIEAAVGVRVPRPAADEVEAAEREHARTMEGLAAALGRGGR